MSRFVRKLKGALKNPMRAVRIIWNESVHKVYVRIRYSFRNTCSFDVEGKTVVFGTRDSYSKEWFFPRCADGAYHEPAVTNLFLKLLESTTSFVDVGAHLGYFSIIAGKLRPDMPVLAYEMDDRAFLRLQKNVEANALTNVQLFHEAVTGTSGPVSYRRMPMLDSGESIAYPGSDDPSRTVPGVTLDDVFRKDATTPGIIKIDVEGADYDVLTGMVETLQKRPILLLEIHGKKLPLFGSDSQQVIRYLESVGYEVYEIVGHRSAIVPELRRLTGSEPAFVRNTMTVVVHNLQKESVLRQ